MKNLPLSRRPLLASRILDIGGGHNPYRGSTHVLDRYLENNAERGGDIVLPNSAILVAGNVEALPFVPASCDFIYASHVLEHVDNPSRACREIMRIGKAGYLETPSPFLEQGLALNDDVLCPEWWFHKWFVFLLDNNKLVFEPKNPDEIQKFCSCRDGQFMMEFYETVDFRKAQHCFRKKAKTTMLHWRGFFLTEVRLKTGDCQYDGQSCRFRGMRIELFESLNDGLRIFRTLHLKKIFPNIGRLFRRYGYKTVLIR